MALTNVMTQLPTLRALWWAMLILGGGMFAAALYWQYALGEDPCQVSKSWTKKAVLMCNDPVPSEITLNKATVTSIRLKRE